MRRFEVVANQPTMWPVITDPARVVTQFLSHVRVTGGADAAGRLMHETVQCHQVVADRPETILRSPHEHAAPVHETRELSGAFRYLVTELLTDADHV